MYSFEISRQAWLFLYAGGLGFVLGFLYDIIRCTRRLFTGNRGIIVQDIGFFFIAAVCSFFFFLVFDYGAVRLYTLLAELLGFAVFYLSFGGFVVRYVDRFTNVIRAAVHVVFKPLFVFAEHLGKRMVKTADFLKNFFKKIKNKYKIHLKIHKQ